ncbi:MAG: DUF1802 family protein [Chthoniobacterales bacterium]
MERVGFKEWALVCDALARGAQSILLRKGGIAEGRAGFSFRHQEFFLFPTFFHEQVEKTRGTHYEIFAPPKGKIELCIFAKIDFAGVVASWETAVDLEPFHIWQREVVRERFEYDDAPGIHIAVIRAYRLSEPWIIPNLPAYGGCRSWISLPEGPLTTLLLPVLSEAEHQKRLEEVKHLLACASSAAPGSTGWQSVLPVTSTPTES